MIVVSSIEQFHAFVAAAKAKGIPMQILKSERQSFHGGGSIDSSERPNTFLFTYVLCCQLYTVYLSSKSPMAEKDSVRALFSEYDALSCAKLKLSQGTITVD